MNVHLLSLAALLAVAVSTPHLVQVGDDVIVEDVEPFILAQPCDTTNCQLPDCRCSGTDIPGGLSARDTPQFVLLTFDDGVNVINIETYRDILYNRQNSNGCPIGTTFFVNHEYTNYQLINELYNNNFEIALHSMSHVADTAYWANATFEDMQLEYGDQVTQMSYFANIPADDIKGIRQPFLQMTGNASFEVMADVGLVYDCSWPTVTNLDPGLWPYTLDYASTQECMIPPCPTASIPGVWVLPMVSWLDEGGVACSMVDSCFNVPPLDDADAWFEFIVRNFERHYMGNRSPFGFYIHEWYLATYPPVREALSRFMDLVTQLNDAFMVNGNDVIDWVRDPVPVNEYAQRSCNIRTPRTCNANSCGPLSATHNEVDYWLAVCSTCPATYPWLGNPLGEV